MRIKRIIVCSILLLSFMLTGCSKEKKIELKEYSLDEVTSVKVESSSWQIKFLPSSDKNIHVNTEGKEKSKPKIDLSDGVLNISQDENKNWIQNQFSLGKEGEINIYLPDNCKIPVDAENKDGNMEVSGISVSDFSLDNKSGSIKFENVAADMLKVNSTSGDISVSKSKIKQSDVITTSGYVTFNQSTGDIKVQTQSGEAKISEEDSHANLNVKTGSGDASISYKTAPDNLALDVSSGSNDISVKLKDVNYTVETKNCRKGEIGEAKYTLQLTSDKGTVTIQ